MQRWFLSYNSRDFTLVDGLQNALRRKDPDAQIFFAPKSLRAGGYWLPSLAEGIADATAFALIVGENGLGPWQVMEYYEALDRRVKSHWTSQSCCVLLEGQPAPGSGVPASAALDRDRGSGIGPDGGTASLTPAPAVARPPANCGATPRPIAASPR